VTAVIDPRLSSPLYPTITIISPSQKIALLLFSGMSFFFLFAGPWNLYQSTFISAFCVSFLCALVGLYATDLPSSTRASWLLPFRFYNWTNTIVSFLLFLFTQLEYRQKCTNDRDLADRTLKNAYSFDCDNIGLGFIWWTLEFIIAIAVALTCAILTHTYGRRLSLNTQSMTISAGYGPLLSSEQNNQPANGPNQANNAKIVRCRGITIGVCIIILLTSITIYISFFIPSPSVVGQCPVGTGFLNPPAKNDLGCCAWIIPEGTCCSQQACTLKDDYFFLARSPACVDVLGLLSCSICHPYSGKWATSFTNITICQSFCEEIYRKCTTDNGDAFAARTYCLNQLEVMVVNNTASNAPCFNAATPVSFSLPLLVFLPFLGLLW